MDVRGYLRILRTRWWVVLLTTALAAALATAATVVSPPVYIARASVLVSVGVGGTPKELRRGLTYAQFIVRSYAEVATRPLVLDPVIRRLGLSTTAAELGRDVTARAPLNSALIEITVSDSDAVRSATIANAIATQLSSTIGDLRLGSRPVRGATVAPATVPRFRSSPRTSLNLAVGLMLGFMSGAALAVWRDARDARVLGRADVSRVTSVPVIGLVAWRSRWGLSRLLRRRRGNAGHELLEQLLVSVERIRRTEGLKSVVFSSGMLNRVTLTTVREVAQALARSGVRVLVVDTDLRRPSAAGLFQVPGATGLGSVLRGETGWQDAVVPQGPLAVLPAGPVVSDSGALLGSPAMARLLNDLVGHYELVVLIVPPVLRIPDGLLLSRLVDGVLVVADEPSMSRNTLADEMAALDSAGGRVLGVVLTA